MPLFHVIAVASALLLAGCASTTQSRIQKNTDLFLGLSDEHRKLVTRGKITEGMSKDAVFLALGNPDGVRRGSKDGRSYESWRYSAYRPVYTNTIGFGYGSGYGRYGDGCYGYGLEYHPEVAYIPFTAATVTFSGDKVSSWESSR